ncbi:putative ATP-dependent DNA helicase [Gordonia polyisoprenivorans NBRC 16320 = JCM 10675]|uniref:DNA 3'-5' helicase n=1 Tax=Gordonia polyisoprenivorans TaxID=84595 RepID=A0A846WQI1_9ACTN|nr:ATP-dependent helicase [Gordonia polyisoprenivorans]NKY03852.1 ATP-dependent helicase [Gordonia polyisoprenivorans]GAB21186.1 putative ATP-dependent DNA helicase [Gordonia polyisoprenivorans NBRC 16320 = JCM 10675]
MLEPTASQIQIRDHTARDLLVIAPAGCGKTEALALRVQGLLQRHDIVAPQKVLVVTFSNRARDNIRERLRSYLGTGQLRNYVSVVNFHGLSARIFKAHANVIGLSPDLAIPESDWVSTECRRRNFDFPVSNRVKDALRIAKQEMRNDAEVQEVLSTNREMAALQLERDRIDSEQLTYDDLPRVAELILSVEPVAELYRSHFGAVIVDEFQDLTPQQLRIVNRIGYARTTYGGDLAQGIYGFAGANPTAIQAVIRAECSEIVEFAESHRSSPAVLGAVNSLIPLTGGTKLTSADPASWPHGGLFAIAAFSTAEVEAERVANLANRIAGQVSGHRIAIMARTVPRRRFVEGALSEIGVEFLRWDDGVLDTDTARVVRAMLSKFDVDGYNAAADRVEYLRVASGLETIADAATRESVVDALGWCYEQLREGAAPEDIRSRIRVGDESTLVTMPGIHVLTGHIGKGQQFDWAIIIGAEDGAIPDFRAKTPELQAEEARVLSVMISRARHGAIVTYAREVEAQTGKRRPREGSPFFAQLSTANPLRGPTIREWMDSADWTAIAAR